MAQHAGTAGCIGRITKTKGENASRGFSPRGSRRVSYNSLRTGHLFCSLSMAGSLLHSCLCFLHRSALWQQREGIRRIFDTPSTSSSVPRRSFRDGTGALYTVIISKKRSLVKQKEGGAPAPPSILCILKPGYAVQRPVRLPAGPGGSGTGPGSPPPGCAALPG